MPTQKFHAPQRRCVRPLIAALAAMAGAGAWADEPTPWYIGASLTATHDSNVFRTSNGPGDSYLSSGLLGGFDQAIGRQRVFATANLRYNKYQEQSTLDNTSYGVNAGWDWATIEKLTGNVSVNANQSLASFDGNANIQSSSRNIVKADQVATSVRWGGDSLVTLDANYAHSRVSYSAPEYLSGKSSADTGSVGGSYRLGPDLRAGAAVRLTRTVQPYAVAKTLTPTGPDDYLANTSNGRNLDLSLEWRYSAQTGVNTRLSWTKQTNSGTGDRDFSGLTGSIAANYAPTAKLGFSASLNRDAGTNSSFFNYLTLVNTGTITGLSQNSQTSDTATLGATYAATAKISVNAGYQYRHSKIVNTFSIGSSSSSDELSDKLRSGTLGVSYAIARAWQLSCNLGRETRNLSGTNGFSYSANTASCAATLTLR